MTLNGNWNSLAQEWVKRSSRWHIQYKGHTNRFYKRPFLFEALESSEVGGKIFVYFLK